MRKLATRESDTHMPVSNTATDETTATQTLEEIDGLTLLRAQYARDVMSYAMMDIWKLHIQAKNARTDSDMLLAVRVCQTDLLHAYRTLEAAATLLEDVIAATDTNYRPIGI